MFTSQLSRPLGARGTVALFLNYYITARILRAVTPAFGRLAAVEARLEGEYRAGVGRIGREAEEIAYVQSRLSMYVQACPRCSQVLRWWTTRARNPLESVLAPNQARQLYLQGMY